MFVPTIGGQFIESELQISNKYKLSDLCKTQTGILNWPDPDSDIIKNLQWTAGVAEQLAQDIGPFDLISMFRCTAVQNAITGLAEGARSKSFHEFGMAMDIFPTTMTIGEFFGKILATDWYNKLGEIALKPIHNTLHLTVPTEKTRSKVMVMSDVGKYVVQTPAQIEEYARPYKYSPIDGGNISTNLNYDLTFEQEFSQFFADPEIDELGESVGFKIPRPLIITGIAAFSLFLILKILKKRTVSYA